MPGVAGLCQIAGIGIEEPEAVGAQLWEGIERQALWTAPVPTPRRLTPRAAPGAGRGTGP